MNTCLKVVYRMPSSVRKYMRNNYPEFWKLLLDELLDFQIREIPPIFIREVINVLKFVSIPTIVGIASILLGFLAYAPVWIAVIFMVHYLTSTLHEQEFHEPIVSPRFWIRFLADLLIGLLGVYLHQESSAPTYEMEGWIFAKHWISLLLSCLTLSCEDFGFYRMYLSLMRAGAVAYRMLHPNLNSANSTEIPIKNPGVGGGDEAFQKRDKQM